MKFFSIVGPTESLEAQFQNVQVRTADASRARCVQITHTQTHMHTSRGRSISVPNEETQRTGELSSPCSQVRWAQGDQEEKCIFLEFSCDAGPQG